MPKTYTIEELLLDQDARLLWKHQSGQSTIWAYADSESLHVITGKAHSDGISDFKTSLCSFDTIVDMSVEEDFAEAESEDTEIIRDQLGPQLGSECAVYKSCKVDSDTVFFVVPVLDEDPHELVICLVRGEGTDRSASVAATIHRSLISAPFSEQKRPSSFTM